MKITDLNPINKWTVEKSIQSKNKGERFSQMLQEAQEELDQKKLKEACQQMESIFLHKMITQMRNSIPKSEFFPTSKGEEIFQDMLDEEYAKSMAQAGGIGLADMLYQQLKPPSK